jgi:hypothetical protein
MTDDGTLRSSGSPAAALCLALLAACGGGGTVTGPGTGNGSGAPGVHTLKVTLTGNGTVTSNPPGINCGTVCTASFDQATAVSLGATGAVGSNFTGWTGACSGTGACVVLMSANATVGATFAPGVPPPPPPNVDECANLAPAALPAAVAAQVASSDSNGPCLSGVGDDGDGTLLLGYLADNAGGSFPRYLFFQIQNGNAVRVGGIVFGGDESTVAVFSQPSGFSAFSVFELEDGSGLDTWSHDGALVSRTPIATGVVGPNSPSSAVGVDPSGGTASVKTFFTNDKGWITTYQRFDKTGAPEVAEVQIDSGEKRVSAVGVALSGHVLVISSTGNPNWEARWVARDGTPISQPFTLQNAGFPRLQFLMDGSLALGFAPRFGDPPTFTNRIEDGAAAAGPLPAWLQQRSGNVLFAVRSGKAYATWGGGGQCGSDLEVLASGSGKSCGCVKVPELSRFASVGRDGSLMVPHQATSNCAYDLYPKLLR